ncbi:phosphatase PAP2 family protein [Teichococcus aestuarii]|nr:phosphatase PAP2 family protein [Pseudoroseomonas aestuarii]
MLQALDLWVLHFFNGFAGESFAADRIIFTLTNNHLFKTAPFVAAYWWMWFTDLGPRRRDGRYLAFAGLGGAILAALLSRLVQNVMWERPRPIHNLDLGINALLGLEEGYLANYSSFPSDNAAMTFAMALGIFMASRRLGALAFLWALVVACIPRVYAGFHYPSDILGGAVLGLAVAALVIRSGLTRRLFEGALRFQRLSPGLFYAAGFVATYQVVTFFDATRELGQKVASLVEILL